MEKLDFAECKLDVRSELAKLKEAARNMRSLQKEYFKNRDHLILQRCKAAEKAIDEYLCESDVRATLCGRPESEPDKQLNLFS